MLQNRFDVKEGSELGGPAAGGGLEGLEHYSKATVLAIKLVQLQARSTSVKLKLELECVVAGALALLKAKATLNLDARTIVCCRHKKTLPTEVLTSVSLNIIVVRP